MRYQKIGKQIQKATNKVTEKVTEKVNDILITTRHNMSASSHKMIAKKKTGGIYNTTYAVDAVVLRVGKSELNGDLYLYGTPFKTVINNSPYVKALVKANGDFDKKDQPEVQIKHWEKKDKELVNDYKVVCNKKNDKGKTCIATNAICIVDYSMLEHDLNKIFREDKDLVEKAKRELINKSINIGLETRNGYINLASKNPSSVYYQVISWSPSNERNETALFTSLNQKEAFDIINTVSGGTLYNALCRERELKDIIKFSKRLGILSSPSIEMLELANDKYGVMVYMKETEGPQDYSDSEKAKLKEIGVEIDRNTFDGAVVYRAKYMKDFLDSIGIKVSLAQATLFADQTRCSVLLSKVFGEVKSDFNVDFRVERYKSIVPKERILEVPAGTDVSNLNKEDYDLIIVGNPKCIGLILDINGGKALKDISLQQIVNGHYMNYLLDVAKCSETKTSGQMIQKFVAANKWATIKILKRKVLGQFDKSLTKFLEGDLNTRECSVAHFLVRHHEEGIANTEVMKSIITTELAIIESMLKNYKVELDAIFLRALFDDSYFITGGKINGVLGVSKYTGKLEAYSYDVELKFKDEIEAIYADDNITNKEEALDKLLTGVVFKYPSPSADESAVMTFKTRKTLVERIANNKLTRQQREILIDDFVNTSYGVIKMAPNNTIKHRLAGMDTDFDGVAIVFEKELVEIVIESLGETDGFTTIKSVK